MRCALYFVLRSSRGRVIDMAGDSVLAVFETAAGAVTAAVAVQHELGMSCDAAPQERQMRFRIGVHMYFREVGSIINAGGPPDRAKLLSTMQSFGLVPAAPPGAPQH